MPTWCYQKSELQWMVEVLQGKVEFGIVSSCEGSVQVDLEDVEGECR